MDNFFKKLALKGITIPELAKKLNVSHQAVYQWKSGKSVPRLQTLIRLAKLVGIDTNKIINDVV
jgi:transcriptional regulator with XRE-family HTH domain